MAFTDIGGDIGNAFSWIGNQVGGAADWVGNQFTNLFGSSTPSSGNTGNLTPTGAPTLDFSTPSATSPSILSTTGYNPYAGFTGPAASPTSGISYTGDTTGATGSTQPTSDAATNQPSTVQSILQDLGLSGPNSKVNPIGALVTGGGLAYDLIAGSPTASAEKQIKNLAESQSAQGQQLESYLANGTLPPGAQQWVNNQTAAQKAAIQSKYAQLGMSGSTAETQELNQVDANATAQMFTIATQLLNTGISETNASGQLYQYLMNAQNADQQQVSQAIQNFVTSLGGGGLGGGQTVQLKVT